MEEDDLCVQEEFEALQAIYGEQRVTCTKTQSKIKQIDIEIYTLEDRKLGLLRAVIKTGYPSSSLPAVELMVDCLGTSDKEQLLQGMKEHYQNMLGSPVLFAFAEYIRDKCADLNLPTSAKLSVEETTALNLDCQFELAPKTEPEAAPTPQPVSNPSPLEFFHSEPLIDRKSVFQAHMACVYTKQQVDQGMKQLYESSSKIQDATHNIMAYRIVIQSCAGSSTILADCDDDGEKGASKQLLHMLEIMNVENTLVVVSRWYGGIQLGPDRFKHINNVARGLLESVAQHHANVSTGNGGRPPR